MTDQQQRMVKMFEAWERVSARGNRYFKALWGDIELIGFDAGDHPEREGIRLWKFYAQERDPARRPAPSQRLPTPRPPAAPLQRAARQAAAPLLEGKWTQEKTETPFFDDADEAISDLKEQARARQKETVG